jgi:hypothetical protein
MAVVTFPSDSFPFSASTLPSSNTTFNPDLQITGSIGLYNCQRKILEKLAKQYINDDFVAIQTLVSQGQPTLTPEVSATREGFNDLRVKLPVLNQYYNYTGSHGDTYNASYLTKIKEIVLSWVRTNVPTGKPIDETNFENLLRVIDERFGSFSGSEQSDITAWLNALRTAKLAWTFSQGGGEGKIQYGNHYTHHYKILFKTYQLLGLSTASLVTTINSFAADNFPFGGARTFPPQYAITAVNQGTKTFKVAGNQTANYFTTYLNKVYVNGSAGNDGWYTLVSATLNAGSTDIVVLETIPSASVSGNIGGSYNDLTHDMSRPASSAGESIDMIRRDSLHYHQYDMEPWIELAIMSPGNFVTIVDNGFNFMRDWLLTPPRIRYEFFATSDSFDGLRWAGSRSTYLQPNSQYWPDDAARMILAYDYYKRAGSLTTVVDAKLIRAAGFNSSVRASIQYYFFRWMFSGIYG